MRSNSLTNVRMACALGGAVHTGKLLNSQCVSQGMHMRTNTANPFQQVNILYPIADSQPLFPPPGGRTPGEWKRQ